MLVGQGTCKVTGLQEYMMRVKEIYPFVLFIFGLNLDLSCELYPKPGDLVGN